MSFYNKKIAVFYLICQKKDNWIEDFYAPQIEKLVSSGLYENIDFIDIYVSLGKKPLPFIPDKTRRIEYTSEYNKNSEDESVVLKYIHEFSKKNYEYNILYFHSSGSTTVDDDIYIKKKLYREYMEYCNIDLWKQCNTLLNFNDTVGVDLANKSWFDGGSVCFDAPHYTGNFWWTTSSYFRKLDTDYLDQKVPWTRYLAEFFLCSGRGRHHSIHNAGQNVYQNYISYDKDEILNKANQQIEMVWKPT